MFTLKEALQDVSKNVLAVVENRQTVKEQLEKLKTYFEIEKRKGTV